MTVKTDKLSENQVAELLNNLMIESYKLNNNGILDVFFNEDIIPSNNSFMMLPF